MITLLTTPDKIEPAYGNIVFQFASNEQQSKYKFRYVVDIYAENQYITRLKITPQNEDWGQCDITEIIRNYLNSNPINQGCNDHTPINTCQWGYLNEDIINYRLFFGEEYSLTENGDVTLYNGLGSIGDPAYSWDKFDDKYVFNGVKEWFDGKNYETNPFFLNTNLPVTTQEPWDSHRYLTNSPRVQYVRQGEHATLSALNPWFPDDRYPDDNGTTYAAEPVYSALFEFYDDNNSLILTGRTYNLQENCGWRPNCSGATSDYNKGDNYQKQYISYLGTGPANLLEHTITVPSIAKWYRVALEKSEDYIPTVTPTPTPTPSSTPAVVCDCGTYDLINYDDESGCDYTYYPCSGGTITATVPPISAVRIDSCFEPIQESPCRIPLDISYVGPCDCPTDVTPTPTPTPSATPPAGSVYVITRSWCEQGEDPVHFILNTATVPNVGDYFCYNGNVYEILAFGGGGFITTSVITFYPTYASAYSICPCVGPEPAPEVCQDSLQISEWFYYYFDEECSPNSKRLMFQNKLGTFDYYTFRGLDDVGYNVQRQTYTEAPELYTKGWNSNSYDGWNYSTKVWNNPQSMTGILRSGFIPKSDAIWLAEELLRSPRVYIIDSNGDLEPIVLTSNEVVAPNPDRPGLMAIEVEYQGGYKEIRQNN